MNKDGGRKFGAKLDKEIAMNRRIVTGSYDDDDERPERSTAAMVSGIRAIAVVSHVRPR